MTTLVERLRNAAKHGTDPSPFDTVCHEAADEIDQLTAEVERLQQRLAVENAESMRQYNEMGLKIDLDRAEAEVERLRAADIINGETLARLRNENERICGLPSASEAARNVALERKCDELRAEVKALRALLDEAWPYVGENLQGRIDATLKGTT